ncbi:MAG TPA: mucoidy inhibitor MuiA family protein, partial [Sorangium sp.]|nr:mucoidy inhibitor MuiA family protein [Sorangium sp.]
SNLEYFEKMQSKTVRLFQGLQQRGTTAHFIAKDPTIVRSDGRPIRLRVGHSRIKAQQNIVAAPEDSLNAAITLKMHNNSGQALLPGSVARYRDGAFLGMTDIDFVARGEQFSLFFSVADQLKLTRELDRKRSSLVRNRRNRMQLSFVTTATNLSKHVMKVVLAERVPISENSEVRVSNVRISPKQKRGAQGIVRWTITLKPGEKREFRVSYQVDYPRSLILDVQRKRRSPSPSRPGKKLDFNDQLLDLEQAF